MLEPYEGFAGAMQRVATANDASGRSYIAVQGGHRQQSQTPESVGFSKSGKRP